MDDVIARYILLKLNEWRKAGANYDVTIIIGEQEFHAHKNILAAAIKFFEKLFTGNFDEKGKNVITLDDVDPDGFRLILDYIYTGEVKIGDDNFEQVLSLAAYYHIECLIGKLFDYVNGNISVNNGFYYYHLADYVEIERLKEFTKGFIRRNFLSCSDSAAFFDITHAILLEFVDSPMEDELDRFKIIMKWIQNDSKNRSDYLPDLIKHVCFGFISNNAIVDDVLDYQLVINNLEIIKAIKEKKDPEHTMRIYGVNGSDLIRMDIVNAQLEATHVIVKTEIDCDEFQIVSSADAIYVSAFKKGKGNRLYRYKDYQWAFLHKDYDLEGANRSIVYSEKCKAIYANDDVYIHSYKLDAKISIVDSNKNYCDYKRIDIQSLACLDGHITKICGSLVRYNDVIYTTISHSNGLDYVLRYDPLYQQMQLKDQLPKCCPNAVNAVFGEKIFIVGGGIVQMYDITKDQCELIVDNEQKSIFYHSLIRYRNQLYAIRKNWDVIDVFDCSKMDWTEEMHLKIDNKNIFDMK